MNAPWLGRDYATLYADMPETALAAALRREMDWLLIPPVPSPILEAGRGLLATRMHLRALPDAHLLAAYERGEMTDALLAKLLHERGLLVAPTLEALADFTPRPRPWEAECEAVLRQVLTALYARHGIEMSRLADLLEMRPTSLRDRLAAWGIHSTRRTQYDMTPAMIAYLRTCYMVKGERHMDIAVRLGLYLSTISDMMKQAGIVTRRKLAVREEKVKARRLSADDILSAEIARADGEKVEHLAVRFGVSVSEMYKVLRRQSDQRIAPTLAEQDPDWRPVPVSGYAPFYEVSRYGQVRRRDTRRILKVFSRGYQRLAVNLSHEGEMRSFYVARLVAGAWLDMPEGARVVYLNGDPSDMRVENLSFTGMAGEEGRRRCSGCGEVKALSAFHRHGRGRQSRCADCRGAQSRDYRTRSIEVETYAGLPEVGRAVMGALREGHTTARAVAAASGINYQMANVWLKRLAASGLVDGRTGHPSIYQLSDAGEQLIRDQKEGVSK